MGDIFDQEDLKEGFVCRERSRRRHVLFRFVFMDLERKWSPRLSTVENLFLSKLYFSNEDYKKSVLLTKMGVARSVGETTTLCDHTARSSVKTKFPLRCNGFWLISVFPQICGAIGSQHLRNYRMCLRCSCGAFAVHLRCILFGPHTPCTLPLQDWYRPAW